MMRYGTGCEDVEKGREGTKLGASKNSLLGKRLWELQGVRKKCEKRWV
jgi:hypothetical protein